MWENKQRKTPITSKFLHSMNVCLAAENPVKAVYAAHQNETETAVFVSQLLGKITKRNPYGRTNPVFILSQAAENIQSDLPHNSPEDL